MTISRGGTARIETAGDAAAPHMRRIRNKHISAEESTVATLGQSA